MSSPAGYIYLNTSYVKVQLDILMCYKKQQYNLNTSYVKVQFLRKLDIDY